MHGASVLAAGAAVGIPVVKGIREHPADLRCFFFTKEPIVIKGDLLTDESQDLFRIRAYDKDKVAVIAEMWLSDVKEIIDSPRRKKRVFCAMLCNGSIHKEMLGGISENGKLTFFFDDQKQSPSPVWLMLEDVKYVL